MRSRRFGILTWVLATVFLTAGASIARAASKATHPKHEPAPRAAQPKAEPRREFRLLEERLATEGFSRGTIDSVFSRGATPQIKTVALTFHIQESKLNYDQFLDTVALSRAQRFMDSHGTLLSRAERKYGVDATVIAAILLVETRFGEYTGKTPTFAILSTFAAMDDKLMRDRVWAMMQPEDRAHWGREGFDTKMEARSKWAYQEICALMRLSARHGVRPENLKGSVMGAVGWPQFLPSSMESYGVDGNGDGRLDLYTAEDAVFSVANYLREHGWNNGGSLSDKEGVIHTYNKSRPYVRTVLAVSEKLQR